MSEELKPCPFCGGTYVDTLNCGDGTWTVECSGGCTAQLENNLTEKDAIDAWNTRPTEKAAREEVLEMACKYLAWDAEFRADFDKRFGS